MSDFDARIRAVGARYATREPRESLDDVERLLREAGIELPARRVAVVGTNGKTTTATYLARLLAAAGVRAGVTTSPHVHRWGERIVVDGRPVDEAWLAGELERLDAVAAAIGRESLRFFDLVTASAARAFAGVDVAVFEAGIGGRLDSTATMRPQLVVLTGIGLDHQHLLGDTELEILREKLGVAPDGAAVVSAPLAPELEREARALVPQIELVPVDGERVLERNASLARAAAARLGVAADGVALALEVPGRFQEVDVAGVRVVVDGAHNLDGWRAFVREAPAPAVAVVSISADRSAAELATILAASQLSPVVATEAWPGRSLPAADLAAALGARAVADPGDAIRRGLEEARRLGVPLVVFGSIYLVPHALDALGG